MQPLTDQQSESLVSYSAQRDSLLSEVTAARVEKDSLLIINNDLTRSNSQILGEISVNKEIVESSKLEAATVIEQTKTEIFKVQLELDTIKEKKAAAQNELDDTLKLISGITDAIGVSLQTIKDTKDELIMLKQQVKGNVDVISEVVVAVLATKDFLDEHMAEFNQKLIDENVANERRSDKLDARSARLDVREEALNLTYGEVVAQMGKQGMKLSDLNKAA